MWRLALKLIWNAVPWVALVLIGIWVFNLVRDAINPTQSSVAATPIITVIERRGVVEAIRSVNKQIFIEHYNMVDVEYTEAPPGWAGALGLQQEFIVLVRGRVPAGFDLAQVAEDNVWISRDGKRVQLTLPPPTIFEDNVSLDLESSRVLAQSDSCPDFLCQDDLSAFQGDVLPVAQGLLVEYAHENGILDQAARDGKVFYEQLLKSLGFEDVRVIVDGYE